LGSKVFSFNPAHERVALLFHYLLDLGMNDLDCEIRDRAKLYSLLTTRKDVFSTVELLDVFFPSKSCNAKSRVSNNNNNTLFKCGREEEPNNYSLNYHSRPLIEWATEDSASFLRDVEEDNFKKSSVVEKIPSPKGGEFFEEESELASDEEYVTDSDS
jgi:hypothetical protein